jgi:threonine synthase
LPAAEYFDPLSGARYPLEIPRWRSDTGRPLLTTPVPGLARDEIEAGRRSLWRYRAALPLDIADPISLGEGLTPLVQRPWGDLRPYFKCEWFSPTGSFKDRGASAMLSFLRQIGVTAVLEDSSGNGGSAIAAYGAAGGLRVKVLAPGQNPADARLWRRGRTGPRPARSLRRRSGPPIRADLLRQPQLAAVLH